MLFPRLAGLSSFLRREMKGTRKKSDPNLSCPPFSPPNQFMATEGQALYLVTHWKELLLGLYEVLKLLLLESTGYFLGPQIN
jgi:hypothetical protein